MPTHKPKILVLSGYGLNCEDETKFAFDLAGGEAEIVHVNDLAADKKLLMKYQILAVPGGFSYGDDTGSGKAFANKLKNHLEDQLRKFVEGDKLVIGICNGFQILTQAGLLPGALTTNGSARYIDRWVDLQIPNPKGHPWLPRMPLGASPWLAGVKSLMLPIAHGEGNYYIDKKGLADLKKTNSISLVYTKGEISKLQNLPANPNGSMADIAGVTANNGRVFGLMPHPERAVFFTQLPHWTAIKEQLMKKNKPLSKFGPGLQIFKNAVNYFR